MRTDSRRAPTLLLAAAGAALGCAAPARALTPAVLTPAFENTIVSTYDDGRSARLWLDTDGRYRGVGRNGDASSGRWKIKADKICLRQGRPIPMLVSFCTPIIEGGVGTAWKTKSVFGEPLTVELVAGR